MGHKKQILKRITLSVLAFMMLFSGVGLDAFASSDDIVLNLIPKPDVDVVLTIGQSNVNVNNFAIFA